MLYNRGFSWKHCWDAKCHRLYPGTNHKNVAPLCHLSCWLQHTLQTLMDCLLKSLSKFFENKHHCFDFDMNWRTFWGAFLFPRLNFLINYQTGEMFWKWHTKIKRLRKAQPGFVVYIRCPEVPRIFPFLPKVKSFIMFNRRGWEMIYVYIGFVFSLLKS